MDHSDVASREGFAVAVVSAAAVLAGLVFLAVTINVERILPVRGLPGRAGESVVYFLGALCESAYVLIPHQPVRALGVELAVTGMVVWGILLLIAMPAVTGPSRQPTSWRVIRVVVVHLVNVPVVLAGAALLGWVPGGLYWLAGSVLCALVAATANAWVLLVEVVLDPRYRPVDGGSDRPSRP